MPWVPRSQSRGWEQGSKEERRVSEQESEGRRCAGIGEKRVSPKALSIENRVS